MGEASVQKLCQYCGYPKATTLVAAKAAANDAIASGARAPAQCLNGWGVFLESTICHERAAARVPDLVDQLTRAESALAEAIGRAERAEAQRDHWQRAFEVTNRNSSEVFLGALEDREKLQVAEAALATERERLRTVASMAENLVADYEAGGADIRTHVDALVTAVRAHRDALFADYLERGATTDTEALRAAPPLVAQPAPDPPDLSALTADRDRLREGIKPLAKRIRRQRAALRQLQRAYDAERWRHREELDALKAVLGQPVIVHPAPEQPPAPDLSSEYRAHLYDGETNEFVRGCPECEGSGRIVGNLTCAACGGTGRVDAAGRDKP